MTTITLLTTIFLVCVFTTTDAIYKTQLEGFKCTPIMKPNCQMFKNINRCSKLTALSRFYCSLKVQTSDNQVICTCEPGYICNLDGSCVHVKDSVLSTDGHANSKLGACPIWHVCRACANNTDCPSAGISGVCAKCVNSKCTYKVCILDPKKK